VFSDFKVFMPDICHSTQPANFPAILPHFPYKNDRQFLIAEADGEIRTELKSFLIYTHRF
jgi:hypothetical protein